MDEKTLTMKSMVNALTYQANKQEDKQQVSFTTQQKSEDKAKNYNRGSSGCSRGVVLLTSQDPLRRQFW
ncbi:hypothetical protein E4U61_005136, partial [Claviceps capensis]